MAIRGNGGGFRDLRKRGSDLVSADSRDSPTPPGGKPLRARLVRPAIGEMGKLAFVGFPGSLFRPAVQPDKVVRQVLEGGLRDCLRLAFRLIFSPNVPVRRGG